MFTNEGGGHHLGFAPCLCANTCSVIAKAYPLKLCRRGTLAFAQRMTAHGRQKRRRTTAVSDLAVLPLLADQRRMENGRGRPVPDFRDDAERSPNSRGPDISVRRWRRL
jgi:hypothetical protein